MMKSLLLELFKRERTPLLSLRVILCTDEFLLGINQQFLAHDNYTDIITFDLTDYAQASPNTRHSRQGKQARVAELYISAERVEDNAGKLGVNRQEELRRVMFHGSLHLCGYKDKLKKDRLLMRQKEEVYLSLYRRRST
jgi:rRNA maturation RNase YbeY